MIRLSLIRKNVNKLVDFNLHKRNIKKSNYSTHLEIVSVF